VKNIRQLVLAPALSLGLLAAGGSAANAQDEALATFQVMNPEIAVKLAQAALAAGVSLNPGPEWSTNKDYARCRLRLCFANTTEQEIREGVAKLAEVCHREFGVPLRSANVQR